MKISVSFWWVGTVTIFPSGSLVLVLHSFGTISVSVKTKLEGHPTMAVKWNKHNCFAMKVLSRRLNGRLSKGVILVFRMFCLDQHLSKDSLRSRWGGCFYAGIKAGNCMRGVWHHYWWHLVVPSGFDGKVVDLAGMLVTAWPWSCWNTGCHPSGLLRPREGIGQRGRQVIIGRMVTHWYVWKMVTLYPGHDHMPS